MKLLVITAPEPVAQEAETANLLLAHGLEVLHVRKPGYRQDELCSFLDAIDPVYYHRLALHQHHFLATHYCIRRLHYPEAVRGATDLQTLLHLKKNHTVLSTSVHSPDTLPALSLFDYTFYGPVFSSISKPGYGPANEQSSLPPRGQRKTRVIGLGGITPGNIHELRHRGFDGAALLGSIWNDVPNALSTFKACLDNIA